MAKYHGESRKELYEAQALKERPKIILSNSLGSFRLDLQLPPSASPVLVPEHTVGSLICCSFCLQLQSFILRPFYYMKVKVQNSLALWLGGASVSWGCEVDQPDSLGWKKILRGGGGSLESIGTSLDS